MKKIRIHASMFLALVLLLTHIGYYLTIKAEANIQDSEYDIDIVMYQDNKDSESMAGGVLAKTGKIVMKDGSMTLRIDTQQTVLMGITAYLTEMSVEDKKATITAQNANSVPTQFEVPISEVKEFYTAKASFCMSQNVPFFSHDNMEIRLKLNNYEAVRTAIEEEKRTTTYRSDLAMYQANKDSESMAKGVLASTSSIKVKDGSMTLCIDTKQTVLAGVTAHLTDMTVEGKKAVITKKDVNDVPTTFEVVIDEVKEFYSAKGP